MRRVGNAILNSQQLTAQQAVYISLSLPLHSCTREVIFINTSPQEERTLLLKRRYILQKLDSESKEIFCDTIIITYTKRNVILKDLFLADFATMYNTNKIPIAKRKRQKILCYVHYNKQKDPENYYREQCLLYFPFGVNEDEHLPDNSTWRTVYNQNKSTIKFNAQIYTKDTSSLAIQKDTISSDEATSSNQSERAKYDIASDIPNIVPTKNNVLSITKNIVLMENKKYYAAIRELNSQQRELVDDITLRKKQDPHAPIHLFLTGGAGTGKTHTLLLLVQALQRIYLRTKEFDLEKPHVLLMAYTGKAAYNIGGTMIHSALDLPIVTKTHTSLSTGKIKCLE